MFHFRKYQPWKDGTKVSDYSCSKDSFPVILVEQNPRMCGRLRSFQSFRTSLVSWFACRPISKSEHEKTESVRTNCMVFFSIAWQFFSYAEPATKKCIANSSRLWKEKNSFHTCHPFDRLAPGRVRHLGFHRLKIIDRKQSMRCRILMILK